MRPNVLLIFTDQHRADALSCAGHKHISTPYIDTLASEGTRFTRAYCTTPLCVPSRTTYFTGNSAAHNGCFSNDIILQKGGEHLATYLRQAGYQLALCGKNHAFTDEELECWDFVELYAMHGKEVKPWCTPLSEDDKRIAEWRKTAIPYFEAPVHEAQPGLEKNEPAIAQTDHAIRFIENRNEESPFFLWLSFEAPHFPYVLPEPWYSRAKEKAPQMPGKINPDLWQSTGPKRLTLQHAGLRMDEMTDKDIQLVQAIYCGMVEMVDEQVGRVMETIHQANIEENTIVIFCSDHGDFWGHRGLIGKSNVLYDDLLNIPTIWKIPNQSQQSVSHALVENTDFMPTLLQLLDIPAIYPMEGRSYAGILDGTQTVHHSQISAESGLTDEYASEKEVELAIKNRAVLAAEEGPFWFVNRIQDKTRSLLIPPWKLITHINDPNELYNQQVDPMETHNRAKDLSCRQTMQFLKKSLEDHTSS